MIVTEKLDGSNVAIARVDGAIEALGRAGYRAQSSPHKQHQVFAAWVRQRSWDHLPERWRVSGEWMYMAHGTLYSPTCPFIAFDLFDDKNKRRPHDEARALFSKLGLIGAHVISDGPGMPIESALGLLGEFGFHGAQEQIEGAVWRVETGGQFNFLCKYVRPDKVDGKYFATETGSEILMCDPMAHP